jgi:hypothetical protein
MMRQVLVGIAMALVGVMAHAQEPAPKTRTYPVLGVAYSDGRTVYFLLGSDPRTVPTRVFPRLTGAAGRTPIVPEELFITHQRNGDIAIVNLAVPDPQAPSHQTTLTTIRLGPEAKVTVTDSLMAFGVAPIQFFQATVTPPVGGSLPIVQCRPDGLKATVEPVETDDGWSLQAILENTSARGIRWVAFTTYRGDRPATSGGQRGHEGQLLIAPHDRFAVRIPVQLGPDADGHAVFAVPSRIEIPSAIDADGTILGAPAPATSEWLFLLGSRVQAARVAATFRQVLATAAAPDATLAAIDAQLRALSIDVEDALVARAMRDLPAPGQVPEARLRTTLQSSLRLMRDGAVSDVAEFRQAPNASELAAVKHWLDAQALRYDAWAARLPK